MTPGRKIRVLICDDSALVRQILQRIFADTPDIEVVATAPNPKVARQKIRELNPDVLTLDIEMPEMDGLSFLEKIMTLRPMPVLMISSLTTKGSKQSLRALELGVVDLVAKPVKGLSENFSALAEDIVSKVRAASRARVSAIKKQEDQRIEQGPQEPSDVSLVAVGASTGGVQAIKDILPRLTAWCPPIVITQHMPAGFTASFAERMDDLSAISVSEASPGQRLVPGMAVIAPGGFHLSVKRIGGRIETVIDDTPPVGGHRPSVDVLFNSVADACGARAVGVLLTGMGRDGAAGLLAMRRAGAFTIGQDEASSTVFGMPRAAQEADAVDRVVSLPRMADAICDACWPEQSRRSPVATTAAGSRGRAR